LNFFLARLHISNSYETEDQSDCEDTYTNFLYIVHVDHDLTIAAAKITRGIFHLHPPRLLDSQTTG